VTQHNVAAIADINKADVNTNPVSAHTTVPSLDYLVNFDANSRKTLDETALQQTLSSGFPQPPDDTMLSAPGRSLRPPPGFNATDDDEKTPCPNRRCASHKDFVPEHLQTAYEFTLAIRHPKFAESHDENRPIIDMNGNIIIPSEAGDVTPSPHTAKTSSTAKLDNADTVDTCVCEHHNDNVNTLTLAIKETDAVTRIAAVLRDIRRPHGLRYTAGGVADDVLRALDEYNLIDNSPATALAKHIVARWNWCLACILRFYKQNFMAWKQVWTATLNINDELNSVPVWAHMVPPHGQGYTARPRRLQHSIEAFFNKAPVLGKTANNEGLTTSAIRLKTTSWEQEGASPLAQAVLKYGIDFALREQPQPYFYGQYGNYEELHTDPELHEAFSRGHKKMVDWGIIVSPLTFQPTQVKPQFYLFQQKDDGSIKERGIQDDQATGLNALMERMPCILAGLDDIHDDLESDEYIAMRDLTNCFWHYLVNPRLLMLMGLREPSGSNPKCGEKALSFGIVLAIMMGMQMSPTYAQFFAAEFTRILQRRGLRQAKPYIDDFTLLGSPLLALAKLTAQVFDEVGERLGYDIATKKSTVMSRTGTVSLGIVTDTTDGGRAYVGEERIQNILVLVTLALQATDLGTAFLPLGFVLMLAGKLQHIARYVWGMVARMRPFYEGTVDFAAATSDGPDTPSAERDVSREGVHREGLKRFSRRPPQHLLKAIVTSNHLEAAGDPEMLEEHPLLSFWWDQKLSKDTDIRYNAAFPVAITRRLIESLTWVKEHLNTRNGIPLHLHMPKGTRGRFRPACIDVNHSYIDAHSRTPSGIDVITSDAATHGDVDNTSRLGFWYGGAERIVYTVHAKENGPPHQINWLEALAAYKALQDLATKLEGNRVALRIDNYSVVCCINKGMCRNDNIQTILTQMWELSWKHRLPICAIWICTKCNQLADEISRGTEKPTSCDFMFSVEHFKNLIAEELNGDAPDIDAFSNNDGDNALCPRFCSPRNSFFKCDCRGKHVWINADFLQILDALEYWLEVKAKYPHGTRATVLVPFYDGNEPWRRLLSKRFKCIKTYTKGSKLFYTLPAANVITPGDNDILGSARVRRCIGLTRWPVEIWTA
jgi:hypothetical protein